MKKKDKGKVHVVYKRISRKEKQTHTICGLQKLPLELQFNFFHVVFHFGILVNFFEASLCWEFSGFSFGCL